MRSGLISLSITDQQLAKSIGTDPRPNLLTYAAGLIRESLTADPPVATQNQFAFTIDALEQAFKVGKTNDEYVDITLYILHGQVF